MTLNCFSNWETTAWNKFTGIYNSANCYNNNYAEDPKLGWLAWVRFVEQSSPNFSYK